MDPAKPDLTLQLPRDVYHQVIHTLRAALPPVTDAPEDLVHRDNAAIADDLPPGLTRWLPPAHMRSNACGWRRSIGAILRPS
jgi:hypothetical protein